MQSPFSASGEVGRVCAMTILDLAIKASEKLKVKVGRVSFPLSFVKNVPIDQVAGPRNLKGSRLGEKISFPSHLCLGSYPPFTDHKWTISLHCTVVVLIKFLSKMNIAIVDNGANLVGFIRMDGAWLGSVDIAVKKVRYWVIVQICSRSNMSKRVFEYCLIQRPLTQKPRQAKTAVFFQMDTEKIGNLSQVRFMHWYR